MLNTNNQSSILQNNLALQQKLKDRKAFQMFLDKTEHITCDAPRGHLLKETPIQQFGSMFKDTFQDAKNLGTALKDGKSNDHSLGRMNDLGMKVGGGLIAAALMGRRATTNKKLMEIAGFGTFFSVMSLWPKVAIDLPTKLRFGFNPHQKYVDSQGRKKAFFQDNQYLPWDVWSKDDINKVADKMKVPTDLKDREEFTKEKMRTVALQDNTLWMATAGFATPLLTSLACNRIEEGLRVPVAKFGLANISRQLENNEDRVAKLVQNGAVFGAQDKRMQGIVESLRNGNMPENLSGQLDEIFNFTNFAADPMKEFVQGADTKDLVGKLFTKSLKFEDSALLKHITEGATEEEAKEALEALKGAKGSTLGEMVANIQESKGAIFNLEGQPSWVKKLAGLTEDQVDDFARQATVYDKTSMQSGAEVLKDLYSSGIKPAQAQMRIFGKHVDSLNGISGEKYNKTIRAVVKALGLSDKEITTIRNSGAASSEDTIQEILTAKLSEIAKDEDKRKKFVEKLNKQIESIDEGAGAKVSDGIISKTFKKITGKVKSFFVNGIKLGDETSAAISGTKIGEALNNGGLSASKETILENSQTSVNSTITAIKNALELEDSIQNGSFMTKWLEAAKKNGTSLEEAGGEEAVKKLARRLAWQSSYGDMMNKGYMTGNGAQFRSVIETVFSDASKSEDVQQWCKNTRDSILGAQFIPNEQLTGAVENSISQNSIKFANLGESFFDTAKKQVNQIYNDKKWMKVFGGITIALVGVTLVSQLFFGKVKNADLYEKKQKDSFESGK